MSDTNPQEESYNIGFISFRFAGTDGVSLETTKWAEVLQRMGHKCFYFCGLSDRPQEVSMVIPEAHFLHPEIRERYFRFFGRYERNPEDTKWVHLMREFLKERLLEFISKFEIDLLIPENVLSYPQNIAFSLALTELIAETCIPTIAHHHDFTWERKVLLVNSIWDYISMAVPPQHPSIQHVVINSSASHQLARRTGASSTIIPNVMDYETPPEELDEFSADVRQSLKLDPDEYLILQPTRVVQRKGIEHAIELVSRLGMKARLVISHAAGDDGFAYERRVRRYADLMGVQALFASDIFDENRGKTADGCKKYSLWDAYPQADLVTYPSMVEGFGNAFLEALYFRKPIVVNNYAIYATDIRPKGFKVIEFDDFITDETVETTREVLLNPHLAEEMCDHNYKLAQKHFSYRILSNSLRVLLNNAFGTGLV
jgi:glycosyltransferase involved in cell wall biosynthesis